MTACTEYRHLLLLFVGDDLDPVQMTDVREHLKSCEACTAVTVGARRAREAYRAGAIPTADEEVDLWPGIRERLRAERAAGTLTPVPASEPTAEVDEPAPASRGSVLRLVSGLAAAAVVLILARPMLQGTTEDPLGSPDPGPVVLEGDLTADTPVAEETIPPTTPVALPLTEESALAEAGTPEPAKSGGLMRVGAEDPSLWEEQGRPFLPGGAGDSRAWPERPCLRSRDDGGDALPPGALTDRALRPNSTLLSGAVRPSRWAGRADERRTPSSEESSCPRGCG